ncbi:hypothetical protein LCGC14_0648110 [marine sediment metagenome]|uniref:Tail terminator n=1 Tax=marine sediment metagenome TaxID=412755 RepID=A0A0F9U5I2_9ZZZZ
MSTLNGEVADPVGVIVAHLLSLSDLEAKVDKRIYGGALPPGSANFDSAVVIRLAGGLPDLYQEVITYPRFELRCYGLTDEKAGEIYWLVYRLLNGKLNIIANDGLIKSIWINSGGTTLYDNTVNRPFHLGFLQAIMQTEKLSA